MPFVAALVLALPLAFPMVAVASFDDETKPQEAAGDTAPAADAGDPDLEALPEAMRPAALQMAAMLETQLSAAKDPAKLQAAIAVLDSQIAMAEDAQKPLLEFVRKKMQARLDAMKAAPEAAADAEPASNGAQAEPKMPDSVAELPPPAPANVEAMDVFMHACLISRPDLAKGSAEVLLADGVPATELALIVDQRGSGDRLERAVASTRADDALHTAALAVLKKVEAGRDLIVRDPGRIQAAVQQLKGNGRQQADAMRRLGLAGSYAVPELLHALAASGDPQSELLASRALISIGRNAVVPLAVALPSLNEEQQVRVCQVLGDIGWKVSAPALVALRSNPKSGGGAREAAGVALRRMGMDASEAGPLWAALARECLVGGEGLVPHPMDAVQPVWSFDPHHGLMVRTVPTAAYLDTMAQRFAMLAMRADAKDGAALSTFLAAGLRLEAGGAAIDGLSPTALVMMAGPAVGREVLSVGLALRDIGLQRSAIHALAAAGSGDALVQDGSSPLISCLDSQSQRVRVDAALALARAMPSSTFRRSDAVVPVLAGAIRSAGKPSAAIIAVHPEDRGNYEKWLQERGFDVVASESGAEALANTMVGRGTAELVVIAGSPSNVNQGVRALRGQAVTGASLMLVAVEEADVSRVDRSIRDDRATGVWFVGRGAETFGAAVDELMRRSGGGALVDAENSALVAECADALCGIGRAGGGVYRMADAEQGLVNAMQSETVGENLPRLAEALWWVPTAEAQRALIGGGLAAIAKPDGGGAEAAMMLRHAAAHARRFGDKADPGQVQQIRKMVQAAAAAGADQPAASGDVVAGLAELYGSLNLGPELSIKQILK